MNFDGILDFIQKYLYRFSISTIGITDIIQIIIISVIVYQIIKWLQLTRALRVSSCCFSLLWCP